MGGPAGQGQGGISIHAPARGATAYWSFCPLASPISIHAPREGGDTSGLRATMPILISIHAPREGGDARKKHDQQ